MKKTRLLLAACALLMSIGMQAQKDVTSKYITNATLSNGTNGWTKTFTKTQQVNDPADAFSNSVRGNNTVGYAAEAYAGWGELIQTEYSMKQIITLPKGSYRLVNYSFFRQGESYNTNSNKSLAYLVAGENKIPLLTLGSITAAGYANSQAEGANCFDSKMYRNVIEFEIADDNTRIEIGVEGTFDEMRSWCIVGMFELFDLNDLASVSSPTDMTYAITNPGFEYRDLTGWTNNGLKYQNNNWADKAGVGFAEQWVGGVGLGSNKSMTQTLSNMPAGLYEISVYGHNIEQYNGDAAGTGMYLTANGEQTPITSFGQYKVRTTLASDGDLTIGINLDNCTGNWIAFDRFELQFYGDPLAAYQDLLDEKVAEAQALAEGNTIPDAAKAELLSIISANDNHDNAFTEQSQFDTAVSTLEEAINTYKALEAPYAAFNDMLAKAQALAEVDNDNDNANSALYDAISDIEVDVEAATTAAAINAATTSLKEAMTTYVFAANPVGEGAQFDCTFMLTNPDLSSFPAWQGDIDGWYTDQTFGTQNFQTMDEGEKMFMEYWSDSSNPVSGYTLCQKVTLPVGTYRMEALCKAGWGYHASNENGPQAITFSAGDTDGTSITSTSLAPASLEFVQNEEGLVKIGLKAHEGNTCNWMGIGYVQFFKVPANTIDMSETVGYEPENVAGTVNLTKAIYSGWNTIVLPFGVKAADVQEQFGAGQLYKYIGDDENVQLNFEEATAIEPHVPYLFKAESGSNESTNMTFAGVTVSTGTPLTAGSLYDFVGTYTPLAKGNETITSRDYVLGESAFKKAAGGNALKAFRAYIKAQEAAAGAPSLKIFIEGMATSIDAIDGKSLNNSAIYNLNGQKVEKAQKGVYIQDGKKFVVK